MGPSSYNGQTTRCAVNTEENVDLKSFDFYAATASRYYAPVAVGIWCANWELGCEVLGKQGHFAELSEGDRGIQQDKKSTIQLPRYYVSWVVDKDL